MMADILAAAIYIGGVLLAPTGSRTFKRLLWPIGLGAWLCACSLNHMDAEVDLHDRQR